MSFDPMAAAVDWLDAYRDADIDALLLMYADDAVIHCGCGGLKTIAGTNAIRAYWTDRFKSHPALTLEDIDHRSTALSFPTSLPKGSLAPTWHSTAMTSYPRLPAVLSQSEFRHLCSRNE